MGVLRPRGENVALWRSTLGMGNLLADVKQHGYTLTRVLCTLRYLEVKAGRRLQEHLKSLTSGRTVLEVARRRTTEEVQELRNSWRSPFEATAHINSSLGRVAFPVDSRRESA